MNLQKKAFLLPALCFVPLLALADPCQAPPTLPPGFTETVVHTFTSPLNTVVPLPDGRTFLGFGDGSARLMGASDDLGTSTVVDFKVVPYVASNGSTVQNESEGGILGAAPSPTFLQDGLIFIYHTTLKTAPGGRQLAVTRVQLHPTALEPVPGTQTTIYTKADENNETDFHSGGGLRFGFDGKLYFGLGDDGNVSFPQNLNERRGKLLRMNPDGTAPTDNPFYVAGGDADRNLVYTRGLRNPFRNFLDPLRGRFFTLDTGQSRWEEINLVVPGANYGWPTIEGPLTDSPGVTPPVGYHDPFYAYAHGAEALEGVAIVSACTYTGSQFPAEYLGDYFLTDWGFGGIPGRIVRLHVSDAGDVEKASLFQSGRPFGFAELAVDKDGSLLYSIANMVSSPGNIPGQLRRIRYTAPDAAPTAVLEASVLEGASPLTVQFNSTVGDDQGTPQLCWNFGDGTTSTTKNPSKTYNRPGTYRVTLTAEDAFGSRATDTVTIRVSTPLTMTVVGTVRNAATEVATPLVADVQGLQPDGVTALQEGFGNKRATNPDGSYQLGFTGVPLYGSTFFVQASAPGYVPRRQSTTVTTGSTVTMDFALSPVAFTGSVLLDDGSPAAGVDVYVQQVLPGGVFQPYRIEGGIDLQSPLPPTGVPHGVLTSVDGSFYLPLRPADAGSLLRVTVNQQPKLRGYVVATLDAEIPTTGSLPLGFVLTKSADASDCLTILPPSPLFPKFSEVQAIFNNHCIGCHGLISPNAELSLAEGFAYSSIVNVASREVPTRRLIDTVSSGDSVVNSWLVEKVRCSLPSVGSLMPPTGKLTGQEINIIGEWARRGAPHDKQATTLFASQTAGISPLTVQFRGGAEGPKAPFIFEWDFGTGDPVVTGATTQATFTSPGGAARYTVTLNVRDSEGTLVGTRTQEIRVVDATAREGWMVE